MYIRLIFILSVLFINISAQAEMIVKYEKEGFLDRSWYENGNQMIERNATLISPNGKMYITKQNFIVIDQDTLEYIPYSSSPDTLKYIQETCEKDGMKPAPEPIAGLGHQRISMRSAFGMVCVSMSNDEID